MCVCVCVCTAASLEVCFVTERSAAWQEAVMIGKYTQSESFCVWWILADAETSTRNTADQHIHMLPLLKTPMFVSIVLSFFKNSPDKSFLSPLSLFSFSCSHTQTGAFFCWSVKRYWATQTEPCFHKQAKSNLIRLGRM